jgi:hypothetical protein
MTNASVELVAEGRVVSLGSVVGLAAMVGVVNSVEGSPEPR